MIVAITGAAGQVGQSLVQTAPVDVQLLPWEHADLDVGNAIAVAALVSKTRPNVIINAAAYTAVDLAEQHKEAAYRVNSEAVEYLARNALKVGARLVHLSTDFVFDGLSSRPYGPLDTTRPLSTYGRSKRDGELKALDILGNNAVVLRTAWVYAAGYRNFVTTILNAAARGNSLQIVSDQVGSPTWAVPLAEAIWRAALRQGLSGILHWTDAGQVSRYDFAVAIVAEAKQRGLVRNNVELIPVRAANFPASAVRPAYSVLDFHDSTLALGLTPRPWRHRLQEMMDEIISE